MVGVSRGEIVGGGVCEGGGVKGVRVGMGKGVLEGVAVSLRKIAVAVATAVSAGGVNVAGTPFVGSGIMAAAAKVGREAAASTF